MQDFFKKPNLPDRRVKGVIIGEAGAKLYGEALTLLGVNVLSCPKNPFVDEHLASHADLSVYHIGGQNLLLAKHLKNTPFSKQLNLLGARIFYSEVEQGREYPNDAALCALQAGDNVFHNKDISDPLITKGNKSFVHVSQGYAKCAVCIVDERSLITADNGMARLMQKQGYDVLQIPSMEIDLPGYKCGFIGGASLNTAAWN